MAVDGKQMRDTGDDHHKRMSDRLTDSCNLVGVKWLGPTQFHFALSATPSTSLDSHSSPVSILYFTAAIATYFRLQTFSLCVYIVLCSSASILLEHSLLSLRDTRSKFI